MPGTKDQPLLAEHDVIQGKVAMSLDDVLTKLGDVGDNVRAITGSVRKAVDSEENQHRVETLLTTTNAVIGELRQAIGDNQENIKKTTTAVERFANKSADVASKVDRFAGDHGDALAGRMETMAELVDHLNATARNLEDISAKIKSGQGTIGQLVDNPKTAEKIDTTLDSVGLGVKELAGAIKTAAGSEVAVRINSDYLTARQQAKGYFLLDLKPPGELFLRLGLVAQPFGLSSQRTVVTPSGSTSGTAVAQDVLSSPIEFSGMLGWRFHALIARAGVLESRPGLGVDLMLLSDRLRLTAETWDFSRTGLLPHAKAEAALTVFRSIYLSAGWDELLNTGQQRDSFFFGAGLRLELLGG
jgi:phospholipid/cholesterol/gamma-HCH transport system substrate-binding protein